MIDVFNGFFNIFYFIGVNWRINVVIFLIWLFIFLGYLVLLVFVKMVFVKRVILLLVFYLMVFLIFGVILSILGLVYIVYMGGFGFIDVI